MSSPDLKHQIDNICADLERRSTAVLPALAHEFRDANQDMKITKQRLAMATSLRKNLKNEIAKERAKSEEDEKLINREKNVLKEAQKEHDLINKMTIAEREAMCQKMENYNTSIIKLCNEFRENPLRYEPPKLSMETDNLIKIQNELEKSTVDLESIIASYKNKILEPKNSENMIRESIDNILQESKEIDAFIDKLLAEREYVNKLAEELFQNVAQLKMKGLNQVYHLPKN